ncbi:alpha/beta fold hydrolase [Bacillus cytotoxicus]|uniref:Alpha/beta fold hydrolase n=1 Tax=Bacillus cytotoxicus TaxID=580165 RepID=A0ACC6A0V7_9BACI|nr:alpha/beta fold hydrolase [Bacillus cytotoxicus]
MLQNGMTYITVNHIRHWCKIAGVEHRTTPIVVVHGGPGGNHYTFERTIGPKLEKFATVIYYEQRGCGRSDAPENEEDYSIATLVDDLEILRESLQIPACHLLGYSFGGQLSLEYALAYPNRVETLLLQAPSSGDYEHSYHIQLTGFEKVAQQDIKQQNTSKDNA